MAGPLSWTVVEQNGCAIVAVRGSLRLAGTPRLRTALLKCLAEQPEALLLDLAAMEVPEPTALSVFTAVVRQAIRWPGTPVLLCAASPAVRDLLDRGRFGNLSTYDTIDGAMFAVAEGRSLMPAMSDQLLPVAGAVRHARNLATEACSAWDLAHLIGPASLVVSELVANAIEHAGTMMTVQFARRARYLHVTVRDGSPAEPRLVSPAGSPPKGYGLMLVDSVATHWGSLPTTDGKVVWATLSTTG